MKRWLLNVVKCETILIVAAILAVISFFGTSRSAIFELYSSQHYFAISVPYDGCVRIPAHWCVSIYWCAFAKACAH